MEVKSQTLSGIWNNGGEKTTTQEVDGEGQEEQAAEGCMEHRQSPAERCSTPVAGAAFLCAVCCKISHCTRTVHWREPVFSRSHIRALHTLSVPLRHLLWCVCVGGGVPYCVHVLYTVLFPGAESKRQALPDPASFSLFHLPTAHWDSCYHSLWEDADNLP